MGAQDFTQKAQGKTAKAAFRSAVEQAAYEHGHGGYTGSLAEKSEFVIIALPDGKDASEFAWELILGDDSRISDKYGPAGCFDLGDGNFYFFGTASS